MHLVIDFLSLDPGYRLDYGQIRRGTEMLQTKLIGDMIEKLASNGKGPITTMMIHQLHMAVFLWLTSIGDLVEWRSRQSGNFLVEEAGMTNLILSNGTGCYIF